MFDISRKIIPVDIFNRIEFDSLGRFRKEEADQEAVEIRGKCEDYVVNINDLQNQILVVKSPHRRVRDDQKRTI